MNKELMEEEKAEKELPASAEAKKTKKFVLPKGKKGRRWLKAVIALAVVGAIAAGVSRLGGVSNAAMGVSYTPITAERRNVTVSVTGTAKPFTAESAQGFPIVLL